MKKIQILSDLHLEFVPENKLDSVLLDIDVDCDAILIAGDTFTHNSVHASMQSIAKIWYDKQVIFIPGNHEYYNSSKSAMDHTLQAVSDDYDNITFLENGYEFIGDEIVVIGACGWHDTQGDNGMRMMNDFRIITDLKYDPAMSMEWNKISKQFFVDTMEEFKGKKKIICMTHNSPIKDFIVEKYRGSPLNELFANDWTDIIEEHEPDVWVSGHWHQSKKFKKGKTLFIENSYGYYNHAPVGDFNKNLVLNI